MVDYDRIISECFWDVDISVSDIESIINGNDYKKKLFLFENILLNSTNLFKDLSIFKREDLRILLEQYRVPDFNRDYIFKRKNMAEAFFFDKPLEVRELKWII
ncbi:MAG TPA: hypothetical protein PLN03_12285 [Spirochaetota bacterium]|nr:hypothetical protein [Spirochaetota bacterium]HRS63901.1 hypothetical protein [Spirochaetota bacterium]